MSVTTELRPETETLRRTKAAEQGASLAQYVSSVVEETVPARATPTAGERAAVA